MATFPRQVYSIPYGNPKKKSGSPKNISTISSRGNKKRPGDTWKELKKAANTNVCWRSVVSAQARPRDFVKGDSGVHNQPVMF